MRIPRLYAIADAACFGTADALIAHVGEFVAGGVTLLQYRNKIGSAREMLLQARELRHLFPSLTLIMNDRADLALVAAFDGVHVGQDDLSPSAVRAVVGPKLIVGVSTHNPEQVCEADAWPVDYIAVGPVFSTDSKLNPDPVIGLDGVRRARQLTRKPLVAIGGVTRQNAVEVVEAGADAVAVIADLLLSPRVSVQEFLKTLA